MDLGPLEIVVILAVVILIFGVGKLPEVGSALGKGIREFRKASSGDDEPPETAESQSAPPARSTNAFCTQCGVAATPGVRFCTACGRPIGPAAVSQPQ
jgi:sec-independent protein translocase protein TatA